MAGTKAGGAKAVATNKAKYGKDFYSRMEQLVDLLQTVNLQKSRGKRVVELVVVAQLQQKFQ